MLPCILPTTRQTQAGTDLGDPLEPPPLAPARGPPTTWDELVSVPDDRAAMLTSPDDLPVIDIRSLCTFRHTA